MIDAKQMYLNEFNESSGKFPENDREYIKDPCIEIENLCLYYRGNPAFENIGMDITGECITAIVGPSGCGKSSFLQTLNRLTDLIPGCEVSGSITINGTDILNSYTDITDLRKKVGLIFQKPNPFPLSISKNIELPLREHGVKDADQRRYIVEKVLRDVGLWGEVSKRLEAPALALSGGQQQRLCIARTLALEPEILLLDEPCSALDPISSGVVEDLIKSFKGHYTILMVTHNLAQARRVADYTALFWLNNGSGTLVEYGTVKQMFESPREELTRLYINGMRG